MAGGIASFFDFYPRSPCGERHDSYVIMEATKIISIHALLAESDYSRVYTQADTQMISIHALLAESDLFLRLDPMTRPYFYPRSPCGERPSGAASMSRYRNFYPRSPCGERLANMSIIYPIHGISIHALLAESDGTPISEIPVGW